MGAAPTGKKYTNKGVEIFRVAGGKLAERWVYLDRIPLLKELGVIPK
jgi:ketosteroid isomerase-like protein